MPSQKTCQERSSNKTHGQSKEGDNYRNIQEDKDNPDGDTSSIEMGISAQRTFMSCTLQYLGFIDE